MSESASAVSRDDLRRLLEHLRSPHLLATDPAAPLLCPEHATAPPSVAGEAVARRLFEAIDRLRPAVASGRYEQLPYLVLKTVFVDGVKMVHATERLLLSRRQLTRECARALDILHREIVAPGPSAATAASYKAEPVPTIADFMPRPVVLAQLTETVGRDRLVNVHGPKGVGKTSLVAEYAAATARRRPVIWQRFRPGTNNTWLSLSFELAEYLKAGGHPELADYLHSELANADASLVSRLLLRDLSQADALFVFDDFDFGDDDQRIAALLDEVATRVPSVSIVTIGRSRPETSRHLDFEVPPLSTAETHALLGHLGLRTKPEMAELIRDWTQGVTHLVRLAASWMRTVTVNEVSRGLEEFTQLDEVQSFLIDSVTDLLDRRDRIVLEAASVFRDQFSDAAAAYVAGRTLGEVRDTSRRLVRYHVATRGRGGDVAFFHTSVRDYFYLHLDPELARRLHERAAEWFTKRGNDAEAAYHRSRVSAGEPYPGTRDRRAGDSAPPARRPRRSVTTKA
jgi:ATP/maltotriose-dependent transcriptional regulator MalT